MGAEWTPVGLGDFNGDTRTDILWANTNGQAAIWELNGTQLVSDDHVEDTQGVLGQMGSEWHIVTTGDFDGDGNDDVLRENSSGVETIWGMNGSSLSHQYNNVVENGGIAQIGSEWHVAGVGNFNRDKTADLVWVDTNNNVQIWVWTEAISARSLLQTVTMAWNGI